MTPPSANDDQMLDAILQETFEYFRNEVNPKNGLVRDKTQPDFPSSIAVVGLALSVYTIGVERGLMSREEAASRTRTVLGFFHESPQGPEQDATGFNGYSAGELSGLRQDPFMREKGIDYFENSRRATLIQREYAVRNPLGLEHYGADCWGITASGGPGPAVLNVKGRERVFYDYVARGVPDGPDDGTISPWAVATSLPFAPEVVLPTLRYFIEEIRLKDRQGVRLRGHVQRDLPRAIGEPLRLGLSLHLGPQPGTDRGHDREPSHRVSLEPDAQVPADRRGVAARRLLRRLARVRLKPAVNRETSPIALRP